MHIPLDYPTLRVIWWMLIGILLVGFAVMDGFDLGIGILLNWVARTNDERRVVLNTVGPVWEGNQIWLILGAGAIFAAWPDVYAVSFSGFYFAMLMVLLALILRPVGFKYRSKINLPLWRTVWDTCLFISGFVPALIFGIAIGNVLEGVPFHYDETLRSFYTGSLLDLLNPFALLAGAISVCMLTTHGAIFLTIKTNSPIQARARSCALLFGALTPVLFVIAGWVLAKTVPGYVITSPLALDGPSNPLHKTVSTAIGAWLTNYTLHPAARLAPACGLLGAALAWVSVISYGFRIAWVCSAISIMGIITTVGVSMFPFILPSSTDPNMSLLVWDASASHLTLFLMLFVTCIFLPIIIGYTSWVYYIMRGKVTHDAIQQNQNQFY